MHRCTEFGVTDSKFYKVEVSAANKIAPHWHVHLGPHNTAGQNGTCAHIHSSYRPTTFDPCAHRGLICGIEGKKEMQITCTCPARAMCAQGQLFIHRCDANTIVYQSAGFGFAALKSISSDDPMYTRCHPSCMFTLHRSATSTTMAYVDRWWEANQQVLAICHQRFDTHP